MFAHLFFHLSDSRTSAPKNRRKLALERLEDRRLLAATQWSGFEDVSDINIYAADAGGVDINFESDVNLDLANVCDFNGDGNDDLVTMGEASSSVSKISVYFGKGNGIFRLGKSTTISGSMASSGTVFTDATGDGLLDFVRVYQETEGGTTLKIDVYAGGTDGTFALTQSSQVSLNVWGSYSSYIATTIYAAAVDGDLAIQIQNGYAFDSSGNIVTFSGTAVSVNNGSGSFSTDDTSLIANFSGIVKDSATINGSDYLISLDTSANKFHFWIYNAAKSAWSSAGSINYVSAVGSMSVNALTVNGNHLYFAGNLNKVTQVCDFTLSVSGGSVQLASQNKYALSDLYNTGTVMTYGLLNADSYGDLIVINKANYTPLIGNAEGTFTEAGKVVAQADYLGTYVVDLNVDGTADVLAVGAAGIWFIDGTDFTAEAKCLAKFDSSASGVSFGDFNADTVVDIAVIQKETNTVDIYYYGNEAFNKVRMIQSPSVTVSGAVSYAVPTLTAVGKFTQTSFDELLVYYTWKTSNANLIKIYNAGTGAELTSLTLNAGESVTALAVGKISSEDKDDLVCAVDTGSYLNVYAWKYSSSALSRYAQVRIGASSAYSVTALGVGDLNGDNKADIAFLDAGTGSNGACAGWILQNNSSFSATDRYFGERLTVSGTVGGFLLADINGDLSLDILTTVTNPATSKSSLYFAWGDKTAASASLFGKLTPYTLSGEYAEGINFGSGTLTNPVLSSAPQAITRASDVVLAKGKTVVFLRSDAVNLPQEGGFLYLIRSVNSSMPTTVITDPSALSADYYDWVDEWSHFYVEIWAASNENISRFSTSITYNSSYFTYANITESRSGLNIAYTPESGKIAVSGYTNTEIPASESEYVFLTRFKMSPVTGGGVAIPENGLFTAYNAGFSVVEGTESINYSTGCYSSKPERMTGLNLFSVRFDYNDDGSIDVLDFTPFANNYGHKPEEASFDQKCNTFIVEPGNGLDVTNFTFFANTYGVTANKVSTRYYDKVNLDPTEWITLSLEESALPEKALLTEAVFDGEDLDAAEMTADSAILEETLFPLLDAGEESVDSDGFVPEDEALVSSLPAPFFTSWTKESAAAWNDSFTENSMDSLKLFVPTQKNVAEDEKDDDWTIIF